MEEAFRVTGGSHYRGTVPVSGAKNVAIKVLIAGLLFDGPVTMHNIPRIGDVTEVMRLITALGGTASFVDTNTVTVDGTTITSDSLDLLYASKVRTSFMFFAPLLHRFGQAHIPNPGGCRLGARPIDRIVAGMEAYRISVTYDSETGFFHATMEQPPSGTYRFDKVSHTGTELLLMFGAISTKTIVIENAAREPEIDDLIELLRDGGATIERSNDTLTVTGTEKLVQKNPFSIRADRNEAATFACMAVASDGEITLEGVNIEDLTAFHEVLKEIGAKITIEGQSVTYARETALRPITITTSPHPGFMTDWQPLIAVLLTQAEGTSHVHERMFENRFGYVEELKKLGADISYVDLEIEDPSEFYEFQYDPTKQYQQAIEIHGPSSLHNAAVQITDLRAGATLVVAALLGNGTSVIHGASHLERGYEAFVEKVSRIGGTIEKVSTS